MAPFVPFRRRDNGTVRVRLTLGSDLADDIEKEAKEEDLTVIDVMYDRLRS